MADGKILPEARDLIGELALEGGKKGKNVTHAASGVNLKIYEGEILTLVRESGCGKNILGRTLIRPLNATLDTIELDGMDIMGVKDKEFAGIRRRMQVTFQDSHTSLSPRMNVRKIISESLTTHGLAKDKAEAGSQVQVLMDEVGIPGEFVNRYPYQLSGGQRQRIGIIRVIALHPRLIIYDEPVSALDAFVQSQVLNLPKDLQEQYQLTYLFISHDPGVVKFISDRICTMFLGMVYEVGNTHELCNHPLHPCTRLLPNAIPKADPRFGSGEQGLLIGEIPNPVNPPSGCRFHTRCPYTKGVCSQRIPEGTMAGKRQAFCCFPLT